MTLTVKAHQREFLQTKTHLLRRKLHSGWIAAHSLLTREPSSVIAAAFRGEVSPLPEPAKRAILLRYVREFKSTTFVETGTFLGETIEYLLPHHDRLITIELAPGLFKSAQAKFSKEPKVTCLLGSSIDHLPGILESLTTPAVCWLDAHYSGGKTALGEEETPIIQELKLIFQLQKAKHLILIDDAREFGGNAAYPSLASVQEIAQNNGYSFSNRFDILRLIPVR